MPPCLTASQQSSSTPPTSWADAAATADDPLPSEPMNGETFENWTGWAELENDPAIFSTLLREWGVPSVRIQEVFELDSLFDMPPDNIFGLVLLSRWTAPEEENKHQLTTAPSDLWLPTRFRPTHVPLWQS